LLLLQPLAEPCIRAFPHLQAAFEAASLPEAREALRKRLMLMQGPRGSWAAAGLRRQQQRIANG
jgi:hypothetical protein